MGKLLKVYSDLDFDLKMLNVELFRAIFIYYNVFQFHVPRLISFLSYHAKNHTHTKTCVHTHTYTNSDKYSVVVFSINTTIKIHLLISVR